MTTPELPASAYRITSHEILALLSFNSGNEIDLSRKVLNLADLPDDSDLVRAGISTLNVRGSVRRDGEEIALQGDAEIIARILASGHTWYQVARVGQDQSALPTYVVESVGAKAALLLQPLSEYICVPLREDAELLEFVGQVVDGTVADAEKVGGGLVVSQKWVLDAEPVVANLKVEQGKPTLLAALPLADDGQLTVRELEGSPSAAVTAALSGQN
ncbi:hypothetical protein [Arthrobacter stackebrandtii]|nr:hypothetical protein [Arthrobacter stackebrandtii]PYH00642.1 hypothetical protein CVV67_08955 [Arthrobacter stackebrandtii]